MRGPGGGTGDGEDGDGGGGGAAEGDGAAEDPPESPSGRYVVLTADPQTGDVDAYGPLTGLDAVLEADRRRGEFDAADLADVMIGVVPLHHPPGG